MIPTEHEATVAVKAAARELWKAQYREIVANARPGASLPPENFDHLNPLTQLDVRQRALPIVLAALASLPDRGWVAWEQGQNSGYNEAKGISKDENPYESPLT